MIIIIEQENLLVSNININIMDMKRHMLIFFFISLSWWVEERKEVVIREKVK
jgi:hypothetical protein